MNIANKVTTFRFLVIPFFVASILYYSPERDFLRLAALSIFMLAFLSDGIDGYLARVRKEQTKAGSILDPLADKILLTVSLICLYAKGNLSGGINLPLWFILVAISRDIFIVLGSVVIYLTRHDFEIIPSRLGKLTTFFQMLVVVSVLLQFKYSNLIWYVAATFTVFSGLGYLRRGQKLINR